MLVLARARLGPAAPLAWRCVAPLACIPESPALPVLRGCGALLKRRWLSSCRARLLDTCAPVADVRLSAASTRTMAPRCTLPSLSPWWSRPFSKSSLVSLPCAALAAAASAERSAMPVAGCRYSWISCSSMLARAWSSGRDSQASTAARRRGGFL